MKVLFFFGYPDFDGPTRFCNSEDDRYFTMTAGEFFGSLDALEYLCCKGAPSSSENISQFLLYLYLNYGSESFRLLDGHFCFCCYDRTKNELILINDVLGQHPLYIAIVNNHLVFSSEYQVIVSLNGIDRSVDLQAIYEIFNYGLIMEGKTLINGLKSLTHATELRWESETKCCEKKYYSWNISENKDKEIEEAADEIYILMRKRMEERLIDGMINDFPISGGYDSRFMFGLLPDNYREKLKFHTNCSPYLKEDQDRDVIIAKILANEFNLPIRINHHIASDSSKQKYLYGDGELYENLRPTFEWFNINGHFSGYIRGQLGFAEYDSTEKDVKKSLRYFRNTKNFRPNIFADSVAGLSCDNKPLLVYYVNNINTFLNISDPLNSGKWVYPRSFFLQSIRTPFQDASLAKSLLQLPPDFLKNGRLFLTILLRHNPKLLTIPFASNPFVNLSDKKLLEKINVLEGGIDYQKVKRRIWAKLFQRYLFSITTWRRQLFSNYMFFQLALKWLIEYSPISFLLPTAYITRHWRYRNMIDPMLEQTFVRIESWLRTYCDNYTKIKK